VFTSVRLGSLTVESGQPRRSAAVTAVLWP